MRIAILSALIITLPLYANAADFVASKTGTYSDCVASSGSGSIITHSRAGKTQLGTQPSLGRRATTKCAPRPTLKPTHPQDHIKIPVDGRNGNSVTTSTTIINSTPGGNQVIINQTTVPVITTPVPAPVITTPVTQP